MDFKELETFVSIVENGSISAAALSMKISQPAVSKRISRIEEEMGTVLFENGHKHCHLTPEGAVLYKAALKILDLRKKARTQIAEISQDLYGTVRIAATSVTSDFILPGLLVRFMELHPGVSIQVFQGDSERVLNMLKTGEADLAIAGSDAEIPEGYRSELFCHDELVLIVGRSHPLSSQKYIAMNEIGSLRLIGRTSRSAVQKDWDRAYRNRTGNMKEPELQFAHTMGVVNAVAAGAEAGIVSRSAAQRSSAVTAICFKPAVYRAFYLAYDPAAENRTLGALVSFLLQETEPLRH